MCQQHKFKAERGNQSPKSQLGLTDWNSSYRAHSTVRSHPPRRDTLCSQRPLSPAPRESRRSLYQNQSVCLAKQHIRAIS